jgi:hypothetical protein
MPNSLKKRSLQVQPSMTSLTTRPSKRPAKWIEGLVEGSWQPYKNE